MITASVFLKCEAAARSICTRRLDGASQESSSGLRYDDAGYGFGYSVMAAVCDRRCHKESICEWLLRESSGSGDPAAVLWRTLDSDRWEKTAVIILWLHGEARLCWAPTRAALFKRQNKTLQSLIRSELNSLNLCKPWPVVHFGRKQIRIIIVFWGTLISRDIKAGWDFVHLCNYCPLRTQ